MNPTLLYSSTDKIKVEEGYRSTFSLVLRSRSDSDAVTKATTVGLEADVKGYESFRQFLAMQAPDYKDNSRAYLSSILVFSK